MIANAPDLRDSTANALKLTCPSAVILDTPMPSASTVNNPFSDADVEWSDEEELLPKKRPKALYVPAIKVAEEYTPSVANRESWRSSPSSESPSRSPSRNGHLSVNGSPIIPPKSPSRPDVRPGSSQEDLVQRFYQVTKERDALRKELQRRSMGPNGVPARASVVHRSDEKALIDGVNRLRYEIRIWSEEYFSGHLSTRQKRPHIHTAKDIFSSLTDNYAAYLKHPQNRPLLIQSYVWSKLQQRIFDNHLKDGGYVWAGKLGDRKLRPINDALRKAVKNEEQAEQYYQWRAMTVNMLVPQVDGKWRPVFDAGPVIKRISRFCSRLRRRLRPWSTESLRLGKDHLHNIVSAAVALDLKMKTQAAEYRVVAFRGGRADQRYGYGFYDSEMEDIEDGEYTKGKRVELCVAPALDRCGNANGHIFEQPFVLVKADVSCRRLRTERPRRDDKRPGTKSRSTSFWKKSS